jgi:hypothetical protein
VVFAIELRLQNLDCDIVRDVIGNRAGFRLPSFLNRGPCLLRSLSCSRADCRQNEHNNRTTGTGGQTSARRRLHGVSPDVRERGPHIDSEQTSMHKAFTNGTQQLDPTFDR